MSPAAALDMNAPAAEIRIALFRSMVEIRVFETRVYNLFLEGLVRYSTHLSIGQEAIAAGFGHAMRPTDLTFATYRGHGHTLARGVEMAPIMAEFMGRSTGLNGGRGGSIHLTSVDHGMMGSCAIVGAHLPIATGAAMSAQYRGSDQVVVCFFGDGATNIGAFHEALNLAAVWKLPVVFVCENNLYMEYTPIGEMTAVKRPAADRAAAYGMTADVIDGNDVDVVYDAAREAIDCARGGGGPVLIEALTYRHFGHSRGDPASYRPKEEVEAWLQKDPVKVYRARLIDQGVALEADLLAIEDAATRAVSEATEAAKAAAYPPESALLTDLWADGGASWRS